MRKEPRKLSRVEEKLQFDGAALDALVVGLGIEIAGTFVEQNRRPCCRRRACRADPGSRAANEYSIASAGTVASCTTRPRWAAG